MALGAGGATRRVAALAGRRVDAVNAEAMRFPLSRVPIVQAALRAAFEADDVDLLVCSAACGADLVALRVATALRIERRIVLPFGPAEFLETSVADRPGDWTELYLEQIEDVRRAGSLIILEYEADKARAYSAATVRIVEEAARSLGPHGGRGYAVWEGRPHTKGDETAYFRRLCQVAGFSIRDVITTAN